MSSRVARCGCRNWSMQARFIGTIEAKLDQKGRAFLPAQFRKQLREAARQGEQEGCGDGDERTGVTLVLRKDVFEKCLVLYPEEEWRLRLDSLRERLSIWSRREQTVFRLFVSQVEVVTLDASGRLLIPKRYLRMAGIEGEVTFVGMDRVIEIWASPFVESERLKEAEGRLGDDLEEMMR